MEVNQIYALVNDINKEAFGKAAITVKDTTGLVSLGQTVAATDVSTDLWNNALVNRIGKMIIAAKRFSYKKRSIARDEIEWGIYAEKVSFKQKQNATVNADFVKSPQADPFAIESKWEPYVTIFGGMISAYRYEDVLPSGTQLFSSFNGPAQMGAYLSGVYTMLYNEYDAAAKNLENLATNTAMAYVIEKGKDTQKRNLLSEYNTATSKSLTAAQALTDKDFLKFAAFQINRAMKHVMTPTVAFNPEGIERQCTSDNLVVEILQDFDSSLTAYLEADTFHNDLVSLQKNGVNVELVDAWQASGTSFAFDDVSKIAVKHEALVTELNVTGEITQGGIIAYVHSKDIAVSFIDKPRMTTYPNPRTDVTNVIMSAARGFYADPATESAIVFYVA